MTITRRVMLYLGTGALLLAAAVAQQDKTPAAPKTTTKPAAKTSTPKSGAASSTTEKKAGPKGAKTDVSVPLEKCSGPSVQGDGVFTFQAVDQDYTVVLTNNNVFTNCPSIFPLTKGGTQACNANTANLPASGHRKSKYIAIPPNGAKDCPPENKDSKGKGLGGGSNPGDITVP